MHGDRRKRAGAGGEARGRADKRTGWHGSGQEGAGVFFWKKTLSRIWTLLTLGALCPAMPDTFALLQGRRPGTVTKGPQPHWGAVVLTLVVSGPCYAPTGRGDYQDLQLVQVTSVDTHDVRN